MGALQALSRDSLRDTVFGGSQFPRDFYTAFMVPNSTEYGERAFFVAQAHSGRRGVVKCLRDSLRAELFIVRIKPNFIFPNTVTGPRTGREPDRSIVPKRKVHQDSIVGARKNTEPFEIFAFVGAEIHFGCESRQRAVMDESEPQSDGYILEELVLAIRNSVVPFHSAKVLAT